LRAIIIAIFAFLASSVLSCSQEAPKSDGCVSLEKVILSVKNSDGVFDNLRKVPPQNLEKANLIYNLLLDRDKEPETFGLMMLLDAPKDGDGGLLLAGDLDRGTICKFVIISDPEDWRDLVKTLEGTSS
jgi:hypothetical protein